MTEKDLDIAIEKCERIMEFDTRTLKDPVSENGWIFEKVYDLLKFLRQFQFATDTNVGGTDCISRQAAIDAVNNMIRRKFGIGADLGTDALLQLPPAQPSVSKSEMVGDVISRQLSATDTNVGGNLKYDEWCTDCREYDQERNSCPRWNRVIRQTVEDIHREKEQAYYCGYEDGAKAARSAQPGWTYIEELETMLNPERGEWLKGAVIHLALTLHAIGEQFGLEAAEDQDETEQ